MQKIDSTKHSLRRTVHSAASVSSHSMDNVHEVDPVLQVICSLFKCVGTLHVFP